MRDVSKRLSTQEYLHLIGVPDLPPLTSPFDPGYDPVTLESHLDQSWHLMDSLKISMACWMIANEATTRRKIAAAQSHNVPTVTGGGPFEVAVAQGQLGAYLDLCSDIGVEWIECGEGFTSLSIAPQTAVNMAHERGSKSSTRWVRSTKVPLLRLHLMRWWREDKPGSMLELSSLSSRLVRAHAEWECLETMDRSIQPLRIDSPGNSVLTL